MGQIEFSAQYVNDTLNGEYTKYENGKIIEKGEFEAGVIDGVKLVYDTNSIVKSRIRYNLGKEESSVFIEQNYKWKKEWNMGAIKRKKE